MLWIYLVPNINSFFFSIGIASAASVHQKHVPSIDAQRTRERERTLIYSRMSHAHSGQSRDATHKISLINLYQLKWGASNLSVKVHCHALLFTCSTSHHTTNEWDLFFIWKVNGFIVCILLPCSKSGCSVLNICGDSFWVHFPCKCINCSQIHWFCRHFRWIFF